MSERGPQDERVWEPGWEGHSEAQARRFAALSLIEKIRWLEEAQKTAESLGQTRRSNEARGK